MGAETADTANNALVAGVAPSAASPAWASVTPAMVEPGMRALLEQAEARLVALEEAHSVAGVDTLLADLEAVGDPVFRAWGVVSHLKGVKDTEELRKAHGAVEPDIVKFGLRVSQSRAVYDKLAAVDLEALAEAERRAVEGELRDARLAGVDLEGDTKERFNEIQTELSKLSTEFSNHLLDATKAFKELVTDKAIVEGMPESATSLAAQTATKNGHEAATAADGPWMFTLDAPSYLGVMQHCRDRALREKVYRAFLTRASDGDLDNGPLIERILTLRKEKAGLLGYENHAAVSLAKKAATLEQALGLLEELRVASYDAAVKDLEEVRAFAKEQGCEDELKHWDMAFWAERLREARYDLRDEDLRPYFQLPAVIDGMFALATRLFGVKIEAADGDSEVWHKDVRFFRVADDQGAPLAYFYLDPYSRPEEKRGGAWMDDVQGRSSALAPPGASVRLPIAHMVCNGTPPVGDKPSLMTHREVETLFHEFGHALQHMLTKQDRLLVSGINGVEWDAVELPSQFMENFCYHKETVKGFAKHHETGEPLPDDLFDKIIAARNFRAGTMMMRQIHFATTDLALHTDYVPGGAETVFDLERRIAEKTTVLPPMPEDRFLCGFSHIFAGGYSAGYYSYKFAEVLSADAFGAFEEAGLDDADKVQETGRRFRDTVLALGGGRAPLQVFKDFRGREPTSDALLRHSGLVPAAA